jgi:hypothetical protein
MRATNPYYPDWRMRKQDENKSWMGQLVKQTVQQAFPVESIMPQKKLDWLGQPLRKSEILGPIVIL